MAILAGFFVLGRRSSFWQGFCEGNISCKRPRQLPCDITKTKEVEIMKNITKDTSIDKSLKATVLCLLALNYVMYFTLPLL